MVLSCGKPHYNYLTIPVLLPLYVRSQYINQTHGEPRYISVLVLLLNYVLTWIQILHNKPTPQFYLIDFKHIHSLLLLFPKKILSFFPLVFLTWHDHSPLAWSVGWGHPIKLFSSLLAKWFQRKSSYQLLLKWLGLVCIFGKKNSSV